MRYNKRANQKLFSIQQKKSAKTYNEKLNSETQQEQTVPTSKEEGQRVLQQEKKA